MTEETRFIRRTALIAAAAFCVCSQTWAREITGLDVSADDATATVTMTAGEDGDSHVLYYAWSTDGADKGADISAWPHVLRTGRVADDATVATIELPAAAAVTAQYACRAFLATSAVDYDYLVEGTKGSATKNNVTFLNTGLKPVGGKYSVSVDCVLGKNTTQQYLFGSNGGNITFCAYVNGGGSWAFACNDGTGNWNMSTGLEANTTDRVSVFLDSTGSTATGMVTVASSGAQYIKTTTAAHTKTANTVLCLWGRGSNGTGTTIDKYCAATIYSCVITNDGVCVRDFRPAVKDGVAGMWDACEDKFYKSAGSTAFKAGTNTTYFVVEGDEIVAQSPSWTQATSDYVTDTPYVEPLSLTFASGGSKSGAAPLTLTGANNWGGLFTVYEGTLVADFGQGLAATDNLVLNGGTYCPVTAGMFTGSFGSGGGQISVVPLAEGGTGAGFSAYGHPLEVTLGGNSALPLAVGPSSDPLFDVPLLLNDAYATDALTFRSPLGRNVGNISSPDVLTDAPRFSAPPVSLLP